MASLLTIPLELLVSISSHLPTPDLAALRLTCKQVESSLYEWFSDEFFTKKQFMLTYPSLQTLIDISKHISFSKKLTHVIIASNVYGEMPLRFRDSDAATCYIKGYQDQNILLSTGTCREMLTEAFANLVNLNTVGVRDFNSASRKRDGDHARWSSWGATTVGRETGFALQFADRATFSQQSGLNFISRAFATVLYALGKANSTPSQFEVLLRESRLADTTFHVPEFHLSTTGPVLQNLKALLLNVDVSTRSFHTHSSGTPADTLGGRSLRQFMSYTPNIEHLRLNFEKHNFSYNENFLEWLGEPGLAPGSPPATFLQPSPVALQSIKILEFGQLSVRADILVAIVTKFAPSLEELSFWRMALRSPTPPPMGHRPNLWADFFRDLAKVTQLELKSLKVGMLQQDHMHVNFEVDDKTAKPRTQEEYTGKEMDKFFTRLIERVFVRWPEPVVQNDEDEEMADEDDEDNEDNEDGEDEEDNEGNEEEE